MKLDKPHNLAFYVALIIALCGFCLSIALLLFFQIPIHGIFLLSITIALFLLSFLLIRYTVKHFIYEKITLIYKNIHNLKRGSQEEYQHLSTDFEKVNEEVSEWSEKKSNEIEALQVRENYRREFIGNISHELKTPIFNIQGYILTLLDGALSDPDINEKYLKRANHSVERMIHIIEDMDTISKLEAGEIELRIQSFDIVGLFKNVFELLEIKAKERVVTLCFDRSYDRPIHVMADVKRIEQVMNNLLVNAINYGHEKGRVEVRFYDMDETIMVEVSDDGPGIPEEAIPRLFERFYRVDKSRARSPGGSGLGLAIVKHIIDAHGQTVDVRSTEGKGSTFSFTLEKSK